MSDAAASPAWTPTDEFIRSTNIAWLMEVAGVSSYRELHAWSVQHRAKFWEIVLQRLQIRLRQPYGELLAGTPESPRWLDGARMNIVDSCFTAPPDSPAIVHQSEGDAAQIMTVAGLEALTNRVAGTLVQRGFQPGDALAIISPMSVESVAIYLGVLKAGCVVVSIPDSFRPKEIATRLRLGDAKAIFTQDVIIRGGKELPLYENVIAAGAPGIIVVPARKSLSVALRAGDHAWCDFLEERDRFDAVERDPSDPINILFSSGTTGEPKAIPWTQTTPIKCAMDAHFHQNIHAGDVLAWPTNLGWMMGPWLIFASLINRAIIGLFNGAPTGAEFGRFVQDARVTMLGVVPSLVKTWRSTRCMEGFDWSRIQAFSLTGECSNADDMSYLMSLAGGRPVIEYCGGTEIGGAYLTGTVTLPCAPATFNTPALGLDLVILDENGVATENGEVFIVPPSIGLSEKLLHQDHHAVYFDGTPRGPHGQLLRRHGDHIERLPNGCYRAHGRVDDTMNLGGIKVSSAEIERVVRTAADVQDLAAIAVPPVGGGPSQLVIFVVLARAGEASREDVLAFMQQALRKELNPLFKIHEVVLIDALPRTASNKVMRRVLRDRFSSADQ
jgi:acetyl-CoA synthetase